MGAPSPVSAMVDTSKSIAAVTLWYDDWRSVRIPASVYHPGVTTSHLQCVCTTYGMIRETFWPSIDDAAIADKLLMNGSTDVCDGGRRRDGAVATD